MRAGRRRSRHPWDTLVRFVLVHGGMHGAWCWAQVIPELAALGHTAVAVELPGHGTRRDEASTLDSYRDAVVAMLQPGDVLVAHSMGGIAATVAADAAAQMLSHVVFLAAVVPEEGNSAAGISELAEAFSHFVPGEDDTAIEIASRDDAARLFYHDCDPSTIQWAYHHVTPQQVAPMLTPVHAPTWWASNVPRSYIVCEEDQLIEPPLARLFATRLGVQPLSISSSHSPFLSRPRETSAVLIAATDTHPCRPLAPH